MKALRHRQGKRKIGYSDVPDPVIQDPGDIIVKVTSTAICGSDLHLNELLGPYMHAGDVLGHETMGIVQEIGSGMATELGGGRPRGDSVQHLLRTLLDVRARVAVPV